MEINVSTSMGFENQAFLKNTAKDILQKSGAETEKAEEIVNNTIFSSKNYSTIQTLQMMGLSAQASLNSSLKETLNYLKSRANEKKKKYIFGELWDEFIANCEDAGESYQGELVDFIIDTNAKNIFAA